MKTRGFSSVKVDGPQGTVWNPTFDPPVFSTSTTLTDLPVGDYIVQSFNSVGAKTKTPFRIADLAISISTPDSVYHGLEVTSAPAEYYAKFGVRLAVKTESSLPIDKVNLYGIGYGENTPRLIKSIPGSEAGDTAYFETGINPEIFYGTNSYIAQVWDSGGSGKTIAFGVRGYSYQIPTMEGVYDNTYNDGAFIAPQSGARQGSFTSSVVDLQAVPGLVDGAVFSLLVPKYNNAINPDVIYWADGSDEKFYGLPISEYQDIGTLEAHLITSGNADMSGGTDTLIGKRHYWASSNPDPYSIAGSTCGQAGTLSSNFYCYTETQLQPAILTLGRYVQDKLLFNIAAPGGILYGACAISNEAGTFCEEGYGFTLKGLLLADYTGAAIVPVTYYSMDNIILPGENVTVPLGSGVTASFDHLDSSGYVGLAVGRGDILPGFVSVPDGHSYTITGGLAFSGVSITFPYDTTGLTIGQQNQLKVVRVLDQTAGLFEELPIASMGGGKVTVNVTSFGKFMVVAPAYATPHPVSGGSLGGGAELEFVSNAAVSLEGISGSSIYSAHGMKVWV